MGHRGSFIIKNMVLGRKIGRLRPVYGLKTIQKQSTLRWEKLSTDGAKPKGACGEMVSYVTINPLFAVQGVSIKNS